ncbi:hypothetical protein [Nesterenkonia suensis]
METVDVTSTPDEFSHIHHHAVQLRRLGVRADDILAGVPPLMRDRDHYHQWQEHAAPLAPYTSSPLLELALWTITKTTIDRKDPS